MHKAYEVTHTCPYGHDTHMDRCDIGVHIMSRVASGVLPSIDHKT